MTDVEIRECLRTMGVRCFIRFFGMFAEEREPGDLALRLHAEQNRQYQNREPAWEPWSCGWALNPIRILRVPAALHIIQSGGARRALQLAGASNLRRQDIGLAEEWLRRYRRK